MVKKELSEENIPRRRCCRRPDDGGKGESESEIANDARTAVAREETRKRQAISDFSNQLHSYDGNKCDPDPIYGGSSPFIRRTREQAIDLARNLQPDGLTLYRVRFPAWLNLYLNFRRCPLCTGGCVIRPRGQRHHLRPDRIWFSVFVFLPQKTTTPNAGCKVQRKNYYHTISHTEFKQFGRTMTIKAPTKKSYNVDVNCLTMWPCKRATPRTDAVQ